MPEFHLIGFLIPGLFALLYFPASIRYCNKWYWLILFIVCSLTYLSGTERPGHGIHFWPVYLFILPLHFIPAAMPANKQIPTGVLAFLSFISLLIPDLILTISHYGDDGIIGGRGWSDGLIRFSLIPWCIYFIISMARDYSHHFNQQSEFSFSSCLSHHFRFW